jgi:hypothetical protein
MKLIKNILNSNSPFFKGSPKFMRLGFLGFVVAVIGVAIGFVSQSIKPIAYIAFGITLIGVVIGFIAIAWGWFGGSK